MKLSGSFNSRVDFMRLQFMNLNPVLVCMKVNIIELKSHKFYSEMEITNSDSYYSSSIWSSGQWIDSYTNSLYISIQNNYAIKNL